MDYLVFAQGYDCAGKAACSYYRHLAHFLSDTVNHTVHTCGGAVKDAAFHTVYRVCADKLFRRVKAYFGELRGATDHSVKRNHHARHNNRTDVFLILIYNGNGSRRPQVKYNKRRAVLRYSRYRVNNKIAAELGGVVGLDRKTCLYTGAYHHRICAGELLHRRFYSIGY